jgi:MYXO-CTERM domain-containing protein
MMDLSAERANVTGQVTVLTADDITVADPRVTLPDGGTLEVHQTDHGDTLVLSLPCPACREEGEDARACGCATGSPGAVLLPALAPLLSMRRRKPPAGGAQTR